MTSADIMWAVRAGSAAGGVNRRVNRGVNGGVNGGVNVGGAGRLGCGRRPLIN